MDTKENGASRTDSEADAAKKAAEAEKAAADARAARIAADRAERDKWAALVPDLSKVQLGATTASGDQAVRGSALALRALDDAAAKVAEVVAALKPSGPVLVTADVDLAGGEAAHRAVLGGVQRLTRTADELLKTIQPSMQEAVGVLGVGALVAQAVPALMQLTSSKRTVTTAAVPADDLASAACVLGKLMAKNVVVRHDDFRMPTATRVEAALAALDDRRAEVAERIDRLGGAQEAERDELKSFLASVDTFLAAVTAVPAGATRSPWADACLHDALHDGSVDHVVLVKGAAGTTTQLVNDRPIGRDDVSLVADVSITYLVLRLADNRLVAAGAAAGTATMTGKIGKQLRVTP
ncbi:hypothetical protein SUDANB95_02484 [Actinosynnema sp. ALI-1.44]